MNAIRWTPLGALMALALAGCAGAPPGALWGPAPAGGLLSGGLTGTLLGDPLRGAAEFQYVDPSPAEELWVVAQAKGPGPASTEESPGSGALLARKADGLVPIPLKRTEVSARVAGFIGSVAVRQEFENPFDEKIEAVYLFPLPADAAVRDFVLSIGDRRIRGVVRERAEAERIYGEAKRQGYRASLLVQDRPNVFHQAVANLEPRKRIDVEFAYAHVLPCRDGSFEFVFPMVVGPRYNPAPRHGAAAPGPDAGGFNAAHLPPGRRSGRDIALRVEVEAGAAIGEIACPTHDVALERPSPTRAVATLNPSDAVPNRDFVLRFGLAGDGVRTALLVDRKENGGHFALVLHPPASEASLRPRPMEMVFVLDASGSMQGRPLDRAREAVETALRRLGPSDTFSILRFSNDAAPITKGALPATPENVAAAIERLRGLTADGGTEMGTGVRAALSPAADPERPRLVTFLTDGFIGNEEEVFAEVRRLRGGARIFSFGVGTSVNRHLLEGLAREGRGAVAFIGPSDDLPREIGRFYDRVRRPALTDVAVAFTGMKVSGVHPGRVPDLFAGRPAAVVGRFEAMNGERPALRVTGRENGAPREFVLPLEAAAASGPDLAAIWARARILDLLGEAVERPAALSQARDVALENGLVSPFTSFLAVDASAASEGPAGKTVAVPLESPAP